MTQTFARILGTMVLTYLNAHHLLGGAFTLTPEETAYVGDAIIFALMLGWSYFEKLSKGHITATGASIPPAFEIPIRTATKEVNLNDKIES